MNRITHIAAILLASLFPALALAQSSGQPTLSQLNNANDVITRISSFADVVVYILVALAVVYIVYATVQYFVKGTTGDENRRAAGMQILWGIIGLAIIVSLWGLVNILLNTFATNTNAPTTRFPNANFLNANHGNTQGPALYDAPQGFPQGNQGLI